MPRIARQPAGAPRPPGPRAGTSGSSVAVAARPPRPRAGGAGAPAPGRRRCWRTCRRLPRRRERAQLAAVDAAPSRPAPPPAARGSPPPARAAGAPRAPPTPPPRRASGTAPGAGPRRSAGAVRRRPGRAASTPGNGRGVGVQREDARDLGAQLVGVAVAAPARPPPGRRPPPAAAPRRPRRPRRRAGRRCAARRRRPAPPCPSGGKAPRKRRGPRQRRRGPRGCDHRTSSSRRHVRTRSHGSLAVVPDHVAPPPEPARRVAIPCS